MTTKTSPDRAQSSMASCKVEEALPQTLPDPCANTATYTVSDVDTSSSAVLPFAASYRVCVLLILLVVDMLLLIDAWLLAPSSMPPTVLTDPVTEPGKPPPSRHLLPHPDHRTNVLALLGASFRLTLSTVGRCRMAQILGQQAGASR